MTLLECSLNMLEVCTLSGIEGCADEMLSYALATWDEIKLAFNTAPLLKLHIG